MSVSLPALQEHAAAAAEAFCQRYVQPPKRKRRLAGAHTQCNTAPAHRSRSMPAKFYRPRDREASPLFQVVREYFTEFEGVYPERYQKAYGYWRPVIRASIDKFLKCDTSRTVENTRSGITDTIPTSPEEYGRSHCEPRWFLRLSCRCPSSSFASDSLGRR